MNHRPRLTVRGRMTLLYTGLFAVCGAIVVAVSYILVAQLGASGQGQTTTSSHVSGLVAQCRSEHPSARPDKLFIAQCVSYLELQGAQHQRAVTVSHLLVFSLITLAVVIALAALLGWLFAGRALRPVHQITAAARAASGRNLSARVGLHGPRDELRELAETFDEMLGRLEAAFESQRRFIANASHELRTPLAVMRTTIDVVLADPDSTPVDLRVMAEDVRAAVDHAEHLIAALLVLARSERGLGVREAVDLATVAEDVLDTVDLGDRRLHATLCPAVVSGDRVLIERLIANLIDNAVRYNVAEGDIWVSTGLATGHGQVTVANAGRVISPADSERIFQPFQRLSERTSREGFGLGLAIVASIAEIHGGKASAHARPEGGLAVTLTIPSVPPPGDPDTRLETRATEEPEVPIAR